MGGGLSRSITTFRSRDDAQAKHDDVVRDLVARRFVQVGGPKIRPGAPREPQGAPEEKKGKGGIVPHGLARPSSPGELAAFEKRCGFRLPEGYRRFVTTHGAGELLGFVRIHAPRPAGRYRLDGLARLLRARSSEGDPPSLKRFLGRFVAFGDTGGGDLLGWNLGAHVRGRGEHPVCFVDRIFPGLEPDPRCVLK